MKLDVVYFAVFREQSGRSNEVVETSATNPGELYGELAAKYGFALEERLVRAAVNDRFVSMESPLSAGDQVVFIPPVAGG